MLRHSSLRPDLPDLLPALKTPGLDTSRLMLTTDGSSPAHILREGHIDAMVRQLVASGVGPMAALQMATRNPALYLGKDADFGGIGPGRAADILVLDGPAEFPPRAVYAGGELVAAEGVLAREMESPDWAKLGARIPYTDVSGLDPQDLLMPYVPGPVTAISFYNSVL
ncbi:adenine deaminase, partial [mine drainage metagenome]